MPNNLGLDPFPDPVGHFGAPWWPFWIFQVFYVSHTRSSQIKKLIKRKWLEMANNLGLDPFPDPVGHFGAPWRLFFFFHALPVGFFCFVNPFCFAYISATGYRTENCLYFKRSYGPNLSNEICTRSLGCI